ncbi:hypothetical protein Vi05172_g8262 [Venturia inaequalis]|nr:hypothetical protein Vi05172_g8262 [Venturia inaequalis]
MEDLYRIFRQKRDIRRDRFPHDLESAIEELDMLYKSKSPMLKRIGHASLLQRRAISIIQLTTSTCLPKSHARDEGLTGALRHPNRLSELESVIFAEANKMLDMTGAGYQDHICLVYLETNEAVAGVVTFVAKLGVSLGIHELMQLAWN